MVRLRVGLLAVTAALAAPAAAERLPIRTYEASDGLAHDHVLCVVPDSRGFLWFCTAQGLSRFDGRRFVNYGAAHGLGELYVNDFLETRQGEHWLATNGAGIYRFDTAQTRFVHHPVGGGTASNRVNAIREDASGTLWAGTDDGLFRRAGPEGFRQVDLSSFASGRVHVRRIAMDAAGDLLVATTAGLLRVDRSGDAVALRGAASAASVYALLVDREGHIWTGQEAGVSVYDADGHALDSPAGHERHGPGIVRALFQREDGRVLVGGYSAGGLHEWDGPRHRSYTTSHGLSDSVVTAMAEDRSGNLWLGTETGGAMRLARSGFVTYGTADGLGHRRVVSIFTSQAGELCVLTAMRYLNRFDGERFVAMRPRLPVPPSIQSAHSILQDASRRWWVATARGLAVYAPAAGLEALSAAPTALYTRRDGLATDDVGRPFEDARGDVWVTSPGTALTRWDRATGSFQRYGEAEGLPPENAPVAFASDEAGTLWLGFREGGLARLRSGRFEFFGEAHGVPRAMARHLHRDTRGRLWAATTGGGLLRIDRPGDGQPRFVRYSTTDGLTTDHVRCLTDDGQGRLYLGTAVGVDRFDPDDGSVTHFTTADGLAQNEIQAAYRDRSGALWFGTMNGVSRLVPQLPLPSSSPALIGAVTVGGSRRVQDALGVRAVPAFEVGPGGGGVRIDYFASDFAPGRRGLFQYRLVGADGDWSEPTLRDSVEYAALAPGRYRFEVRVHGTYGNAALPAEVPFVVRPPLWRHPWFIAVAAAASGLLVYRLHLHRVARVVELERVRTRIATDLHDDIGSSLSQIAILSEVAARESREPSIRRTLGDVAAACRETVDGLGDIVWAMSPSRDRLGDLVHRMRRFASDVFTAREVEFRFEASVPDDVPMGADLRRHVLLVFKEAVHNAVRHSACRRAEARITLAGGRLQVVLHDDGRGFDPARGRAGEGHGLASMEARARSCGGSIEFDSGRGGGTTVRLSVPLVAPGQPS